MVPSMVGFLPENSMVILAFRDRRTCSAIRFDLPPVDTKLVHRRVASTILGTVCELSDVDSIVLVIYSGKAFGSGRITPRSDFVGVLI